MICCYCKQEAEFEKISVDNEKGVIKLRCPECHGIIILPKETVPINEL